MFKVTKVIDSWFTKGHIPQGSWHSQPARFRFYVNMLEFGRRLRHLISLYRVEIVVLPVFLLLLWAFTGCITRVIEPTDVVQDEDLVDIAENYCNAHPEFPCGHVYLCEAPSENPENTYGRIEICVNDDVSLSEVEALYGTCVPTPRHVGLCWAPCPVTGPGCNAFDGCFCPVVEPPPVDAGVDSAAVEWPLPDKVKEWL